METEKAVFSNIEIKKILLAFAPKIEYRELYIETLDRNCLLAQNMLKRHQKA